VSVAPKLLDTEAAAPSRPNLVVVPPATPRASRTGAILAYAAISLIWGTTFLGIRVAVETMPTMLITSVRFLGAGAILFVIARLSGAKFPVERSDRIRQAITGVITVGIANS
jgi:drug/metabolite transporter (DMT)-like permease